MKADLLPATVTDDEFRSVNLCIRMASKTLAIETILKNVMKTYDGYLEENRAWLRMPTNDRRAELFAVLKMASCKLDTLAERILEDAKKLEKVS